MPVRCDTWNTTANRPDLVNLIGSKCRAREAWRVPLDPLTPGALAGAIMVGPASCVSKFRRLHSTASSQLLDWTDGLVVVSSQHHAESI